MPMVRGGGACINEKNGGLNGVFIGKLDFRLNPPKTL